MLTLEGSPVWVYDIEVFSNYFLATFYNGEKWKSYESLSELSSLLHSKNLVLAGFNNLKYDDAVINSIGDNPNISMDEIYALSNQLIFNEHGEENFGVIYRKKHWRFSIDVFQILNAKGSLKEWECKFGLNKVAESPCDFSLPLDMNRVQEIRDYCKNDVEATYKILKSKWELVELRTTLKNMYGLSDGVYTMSEQGVAQHTFVTLHRNQTGETSSYVREKAKENPVNNCKSFELSNIISKKIRYETSEFKEFLQRLSQGRVEKKDGEAWSLQGDDISETVSLAGREFAIGVGGIHSIDTPGIFVSDDEKLIVDLDVTSYYPSIIINENLYPTQLGPSFVEDMKTLRDQRIEAKKAKNIVVANALKIVINATFGKLNDTFSPLRSVIDAHRVTVNGQLFILMLIESLYSAGAEIVSANTDGVTILWERDKIESNLREIISKWERDTGYILERNDYSKYIRRDINNYIAIYSNGKIKLKGVFEPQPDGAGKWDGVIIKRAAVEYFTKNIPVEDTVNKETDLRKFLFYERTKTGGVLCFDKQQIGKSIRWYASIMGGAITRYNPNAKVRKDGTINYYSARPHGESSSLANDISGWDKVPEDIDRQYYIDQAKKLIESIQS